jgi:heme exporter protein A
MRAAGSATGGWALESDGLVRRFGPAPALRGVTLRVGWGECVALLGANGAGKTTLLKIFATLLRPTAGQARVAGVSVAAAGADVRRWIGFAGHETYLYDDLTAEENLVFYARLYGVDRPFERVGEVLRRCGLWERRRERVRALSRGLQQRVTLARALLHDPAVLLLDEPDTGVDAAGLDWLERTLGAAAAGGRRGVLLTTHSPDRARAWCNRAIVLLNGTIAYDGPVSGARAALGAGGAK